jgi:hypothetical protein
MNSRSRRLSPNRSVIHIDEFNNRKAKEVAKLSSWRKKISAKSPKRKSKKAKSFNGTLASKKQASNSIQLPINNKNAKIISLNVPRTLCSRFLPENKKKHLRGLLMLSKNNAPYSQGHNFVALELLRMYPIKTAYKIYRSNGMKSFRMLDPLDRIRFIKTVCPLFHENYANDKLNLVYAMGNFSHFFHSGFMPDSNTNVTESVCDQPLLATLLLPPDSSADSFFSSKTEFLRYYLFILRHLAISVAEDHLSRKNRINVRTLTTRYASYISRLTLTSINLMSNNLSTFSYKYHVLAGYGVMLLSKDFDTTGMPSSDIVEKDLDVVRTMIHDSSLHGPNLQGIKPIWKYTPITYNHDNGVKLFIRLTQFLPKSTITTRKWIIAHFLLGLDFPDTEAGAYLSKIKYFTVQRNTVHIDTLFDALGKSGVGETGMKIIKMFKSFQ